MSYVVEIHFSSAVFHHCSKTNDEAINDFVLHEKTIEIIV